ncbi:MAG TPA: multiprotein bridging factor aMBF1 [Candidatus Lokiarchaeia archaeon]
MDKKNRTNVSDECQICGGKIWKAQTVLIEGAKIIVCQNCAQFGKRISPETKPSKLKMELKTTSKHVKQLKSNKTEEFLEPSIEVVSNYAEKIRNARIQKSLNQDQFAKKLNEKPSLIRRIESGKVTPTIELAKKIENIYKIQLLDKTDKGDVDVKNYMKNKQKRSTLGDIAFIKKKK